jgi:hypothetical protein
MTHASQTKAKASAGDPIPPKCSVIEVHVGELRQLFNAIDRRVRCLRRRIPHHPTELPFSVGFALENPQCLRVECFGLPVF